ncbi:hypothetical protein E4665_11490 [Sporolactobacillus shoreae]|uniref:Uncharacterized protein n=1 Tax=Sporolactobacillus shoreae TaxID=1465501 RepID=A0A4Z0GNK7_9BACL|nr:hypothetical protein [Sporolactobacillus shoreae]TGA97468.1 hypothetical protein E4665_11490 [Sporolactobacillus shoreae]
MMNCQYSKNGLSGSVMKSQQTVYRNKISYLIISNLTIAFFSLSSIIFCSAYFSSHVNYRNVNVSFAGFGIVAAIIGSAQLGFFILSIICILTILFRTGVKQWTSQLLIDPYGVEVRHDIKKRNIKMQWNQIARIEYCGSPHRMNERIVLHSKNDQIIFVSIYRKNYLEAIKAIVSKCVKDNSDVLIDTNLTKRLADFR